MDSSGVIERKIKPLYIVQLFGEVPRLVARLAAALGVYAVWHYASSGLMLAHYDAKGHLVVSRRIFDSLTPGWEQIGAVWLPLPHLINMLPAQIDVLYRTGAFATAVSVGANALAAGSLAAVVLKLTGSTAGAVLAAAIYATNPNVLYLQSTPMTEPLLFGLTALQVLLVTAWVQRGQLDVPRAVGWVTVLAVMTRYEAWPITGALFALSAFAWWRGGAPLARVVLVHARLSVYPIAAVLAFMAFSRITVGEWFVSGGFFVPDESLRGQWTAGLDKITEGLTLLAGTRLVRLTQAALVVVAITGVVWRTRAALLLPLALMAAAALPLTAYYAGHPFRLRYEIPLVLAAAATLGLAVGLLRGWAKTAALVVFLVVYLQRPPFDVRAAMVGEAQLDRNVGARQQVTRCLQSKYAGGPIMMSMGSLGHYMHELSADGFAIRDFLHEGNGPLWDSAFTRGPAPLVEWVIVEEAAEGGDEVVQRYRRFPRLFADYRKVCSGGNVSVYRRER